MKNLKKRTTERKIRPLSGLLFKVKSLEDLSLARLHEIEKFDFGNCNY